jgi:hypothetical protein
MEKIDFKKELKQLYAGKVGEQIIVKVPKMNFLMIDGHGDPNTSQEYIDSIQTIYPVAYTLKFMCKKELQTNFTVMPLEGLWWADDMSNFASLPKSEWSWRLMIMQPSFITSEMFERAITLVSEKKKPVSIDKIRFEPYDEGRAAQVMYVGAYANEGPAIQALHAFITDQGGSLRSTNKNHHEIYLGDPRKTEASKLKTIIRQPF